MAVLRTALDALPDDSREVVTLYYREDCSIRQVAQLLDLSEDAIKQRLNRARQKLRSQMEAQFSDKARKTAPGLAFTAAVTSGLAFGAPVSASAAVLSVGAKCSPGLTAGVAAGGLGGFLAGALAVIIGTRKGLERAIDERERRGLIIAAVAQMFIMASFAGFILAWPLWSQTRLKDHPPIALAAIALYWLGMNATVLLWTRRVTRRRRELQRIQDPEAWAMETRSERFGVMVSVAVLLLMLIGFGGALYLRLWLQR
jgi:hypothetical protein